MLVFSIDTEELTTNSVISAIEIVSINRG